MLYLYQRLKSPFSVTFPEELANPYNTEGTTIGHRVLEKDKEAQDIPSQIFERLDSVLTKVKNEVAVGTVTTIEDAKNVLGQIENILTNMNFICSIPIFLVDNFAQGLQVSPLNTRVIYTAENQNRLQHILSHQNEGFSHLDCDLGSLLYLSIGEILNIPLRMVEVPEHNFIRWRLNNNQYLNWDTNYGFNKFSDSEYAAHYGVTTELIVNGTYLSDLTTENTEGYFHFIRGISFQKVSKLVRAVEEYKLAIKKYPQSPSSRNNLAWLFVSEREVQQIVSKEEALKVAIEACQIYKKDDVLDTLACMYAECGQFEKAILLEEEAYELNPSQNYQAMIQAFREGKTYLQIHNPS